MLGRGVITVLFVACVLFIWRNSMESAAASSARSGRVTELVNQVLSDLGGENVTEHFIRKLAHFSEYGMEGVLTVLLFMIYYLKPGERVCNACDRHVYGGGGRVDTVFFCGEVPGDR